MFNETAKTEEEEEEEDDKGIIRSIAKTISIYINGHRDKKHCCEGEAEQSRWFFKGKG
jgi:hypothetical protein